MAIIEFPTAPPYGNVPVNTDTIYAAVPDAADPQRLSDLLIDSASVRSIQVLIPVDQAGQRLGAGFIRFEMAALSPSYCYVNRTTWVSIVPHPQISGVTQINFRNHYLAVKGTVAQVRAALGG